MLPDEIDKRIRLEASSRGISVAEIVREALEARYVQDAAKKRFTFVGSGMTGDPDFSSKLDAIWEQGARRGFEAGNESHSDPDS